MNKKIWVYTKCDNYYKLLNKISKIDIKIDEIKKIDKKIYFKIRKEDYKKLNKYLVSYKFKIESTSLKEVLKKDSIFFISLLVGIFLFFILNRMVFKINIIHENKEIRELIKDELDEYGIKVLSFKKSYKELNQIKESILDKYPDKLDWIEFESKGLVLNVHIEKRVITNISSSDKICDVVAIKDGVIKEILVSSGEVVVNINDYVRRGDTLIKGIITYNEEEKRSVCASGEVYATTYYTGSVSIPKNTIEDKNTKKKRYNLTYEDNGYKHQIFKNRLDNYTSSYKLLLQIFDFKLYIEKQEEVVKINKTLNSEELEKMGVEKVIKAINDKNKQKITIIDKKVLKKVENNSTMDIEVFVVAKELISTQEEKD